MKENQYLIDYYNSYDESSRLESKHGTVEFLTTMRYIEKYIREGDSVLEIGAATGRYSHALARRGYTVDAVELVEHNIEIFRQNTLPDEKVTVTQGNALDLSAFPDNKYDVTLLLGPLYHLYNDEDKRQALSEAIRVTKKGGVIFAALSPTAVSLTRALDLEISVLRSTLKTVCLTPRRLPQYPNQKTCSSLSAKRTLTA